MEFFNKLVDLFINGHYAVGIFAFILLIIGALIFNYAKIVSFGDERKRVKLAKIKDALECEYISESDKSHLQDALATEHFSICTGIYAEKELREAIVKHHQACDGSLRFVHFKRAVPYIRFEDEKLTVNITKYENISFWYNLLAAISCFFLGIFLLIIISFMDFDSNLALLKHLGKSLFICSLSALLFFETLPIFSAKHVRGELVKQSDKSASEVIKSNI